MQQSLYLERPGWIQPDNDNTHLLKVDHTIMELISPPMDWLSNHWTTQTNYIKFIKWSTFYLKVIIEMLKVTRDMVSWSCKNVIFFLLLAENMPSMQITIFN